MVSGKLSGKIILFTTIQPAINNNKLLICLLLCVATLGGCTKRQIAESTCQMDAEPQFWIRVRLLNDVNNCTIIFNQSFTVINPQANVRFDQPETIISLSLDERPTHVGIDPYNKLVDRNSDDNVKSTP